MLHLTFAGMPASATVEIAVAQWYAWIFDPARRPERCTVAIERAARDRFRVDIDVTIGGLTLAVRDHVHDDVYLGLADAFLAARRLVLARAGASAGSLERGLRPVDSGDSGDRDAKLYA